MRALRASTAALASAVTVLVLFPAFQARGWSDHAHGAAAKTPTAAPSRGKNSCTTCLERGVLLDPNQFAQGYPPEVKAAYEVARKYPDLIDRIHCFCECKESTREHHKTLLTCFTNLHAAGCGICQHEALMAAQMKDQGASDDEVEITVEALHKTDGHPPTFGRGL